MRVVHVVAGLQKASGVTTFIENVGREQRSLGHEVEVRTDEDDESLCAQVAYSTVDVFHLHGLWSPLLHRASRLALRHGVPVVWSTHGMTAPWSMRHKWWKKLLAWWLYQKWDLKRAAAIHCTTELEVDWNKTLGFKNCFVAPLGTGIPNRCPTPKTYTSASKTLLFVGRIYPVKALDRLIKAFARVDASVRRNWTLRLVGPNQAGYMAELMTFCGRLGISYSTPEQESSIHCMTTTSGCNSTIQFAGPKFNEELDAEYDNCDALALVSHTENFGATVVDAMAHGKPVIASTKTPWKVVADNKCGWWVCNDVEPLSAVLVELMTRSDADRLDMGLRGRKLVKERYTWSAVCDKMMRGYEEVLNGRA